MKPIRFLPDARAEQDAAIDWYEDRRPGLGSKFFQQIRSTLDRIRRNPLRFPVVHKNEVRKLRIKGFPFIVVYQSLSNDILVVSIFHTSRDPAEWMKRLPGPR